MQSFYSQCEIDKSYDVKVIYISNYMASNAITD